MVADIVVNFVKMQSDLVAFLVFRNLIIIFVSSVFAFGKSSTFSGWKESLIAKALAWFLYFFYDFINLDLI